MKRVLYAAKRAAGIMTATAVLLTGTSVQQAIALSQYEREALQYNGPMYLPETTCSATGSVGSADGQELDGFRLPASHGYTGNEEAINTQGVIPRTGGGVAFAQHASKGQAYRDYYITMRWTYAEWYWNGDANVVDNEQVQWLGEKPRLVLVTNPRTNKSIIAAVLEAGPAPWTGIDTSENNNAKHGWQQPQIGTPPDSSGYKGRVSGFPPRAIQELGAEQGQGNGEIGHDLLYAWAPDQNATPGPTDLSVTDTGSPDSGICPAAGQVNAQGYAFPLGGLSKQDISSGYNWPCPGICHHDNSVAFDLTHRRTANGEDDAAGLGLPVRAIHNGTIQRLNSSYDDVPGCYSFQLVGDDGWWYWYGHMANPKDGLQDGREVQAGEMLAEIGPRTCTDGSYPHLHIDRGSPRGHHGGGHQDGPKHRDPGMTDLINTLYNELEN